MKKIISILTFIAISNLVIAQWEFVNKSYNLPLLNAVEFFDYNNGITIGIQNNGVSVILRTSNNGNSFDTVYYASNSNLLTGISYVDSNIIYVVGNNTNGGVIIKSTDSGFNWISTPTTIELENIEFYNSNLGFACGRNGEVIKTIDGGINWSNITTGVNFALKDIEFINTSIGFISGDYGVIKTIDGGSNWSYDSLTNSGCVISFPSDSIGYCLTSGFDSARVFKTTNQGATWNVVNYVKSYFTQTSIQFVDDLIGYTTGYFNVNKTIDGGVNWTEQIADNTLGHFMDDVNEIFCLNKETAFIVGYNQFYRIPIDSIIINSHDVIVMDNEFEIYPNPSINIINFKIKENKNGTLQIINSLGNIVFSQKTNNEITRVNISSFENGIYLVKLICSDEIMLRKIIITH